MSGVSFTQAPVEWFKQLATQVGRIQSYQASKVFLSNKCFNRLLPARTRFIELNLLRKGLFTVVSAIVHGNVQLEDWDE